MGALTHIICLFYPYIHSCNDDKKGTHEEILNFVEENFAAKDKFTWFEKGKYAKCSTSNIDTANECKDLNSYP